MLGSSGVNLGHSKVWEVRLVQTRLWQAMTSCPYPSLHILRLTDPNLTLVAIVCPNLVYAPLM